jgi:polyhydroxyalkanoate synthesis regulator phasin
MTDPANDFIRDYQALAQQSWDTWARQLQQPAGNPFTAPAAANPFAQPAAGNPFAASSATSAHGNETLERTLAGLKGYFDWMQGAVASGTASAQAPDWRQQMQQLFGGAGQPFAQAFTGIDSAGSESFARQWQSWMSTGNAARWGNLSGAQGPTPAFGLSREQQMQQQSYTAALLESVQASSRYQALVQRANAQGMEKLQDKLAQHAEPGRQIESLKALYDLWVDAAEEAYAEIALSDEFRQVYGDMVNSQMRVRQFQLQQTEQMCQQLGLPTRSEVASLGERMQALRREVRGAKPAVAPDHAEQIAALQGELADLKWLVGGRSGTAARAGKSQPKAVAPGRRIAAVKKSKAKAPAAASRAPASPKAAALAKARSKAATGPQSRKRK